jgi:antitoxin component of MazEF toxin-antitoxin module
MPDANPLLIVTRWRRRAEEILAQAETTTDADARQEMRETAAAYECLAEEFEREFPEKL